MEISTRKILFIQEFLRLKNEKVILQLENLLQNNIKETDDDNIHPMSIEELNRRIDLSLDDSKNDNLTEVNELISEIEK
jgi:hypothetical protein